MPGISLLHGDCSELANRVDSAFDSVRFLEDYESQKVVQTDRAIVGYSGYPGYPIEHVETNDAVVLLEGELYDVDDTADHLRWVADQLTVDDSRELADWVSQRDGDFLVVVYRKDTEAIYVLNDTFCRLPTYLTSIEGTTVLSRELKFVREMARRQGSPLELDQLGAAQQFLFGYTLGTRTVFEDTKLIPPGSNVHVDDEVQTERLYRHRFDQKSHTDRTVEENAANLADLFATACTNRDLDGKRNVISLSGGLDSRAVAGVYDQIEIPCVAATFDTEDGTFADDARIAESTAETLDLDWQQYVTTTSSDNYDRMLDMKQGMNYLGMTFILDFFDQLREEYASLNYVTGDGGDKVLVDLTPARNFQSLDDLVDYAIDSNSRVPLTDAAAVADVNTELLRSSVEARLRSYPETDLSQKYAHFLVRERGFNFLNQGEDRNRYYFWSSTPFYSLPVFQYAMNCPDEQKRQRDLYIAFLERFSPELLDLEYPNFGAPITSLEYRLKRFTYDFLSRFPGLQATVVDLVSSSEDGHENVARNIQNQVAETDLRPLSERHITDVTDDCASYDVIPMNYLYTLTSLVEDMRRYEGPDGVEGERDRKPSVPKQ